MPTYGKGCMFHQCQSKSKIHVHTKFYPFVKPWKQRDRCLQWILATGRNDLTPEHINKSCYVCEDHFVDGAPTVENPDPRPYPYIRTVVNEQGNVDGNARVRDDPPEDTHFQDLADDFKADISTCEQVEGPGTLCNWKINQSPARRAAMALKKKALSPRVIAKENQHPYRRPSSNYKVAGVSKDQKEPLPQEIPVPPQDLTSSLQENSSSFVQPSNNGSNISSKETAHGSIPETPSDEVRSVQRRLFEEFFRIPEEHREGISLLGDNIPQRTSASVPSISGEESVVTETGVKCSVGTQTWSKSFVNRLIAAGKLSKVSFKPEVVKTVNAGGNIIILQSDAADNYIEGGGAQSEVPCGGSGERPPSPDSDEGEERMQPEEDECGNATEKPNRRTGFMSFEKIDSDEDFEFLCGLSRVHFDLVYEYIGGNDVCAHLKYECASGTPKRLRDSRLSYRTRLFMTLCRLRRGFTERELAILFGCSETLVSRIVNTSINFLFLELKPLDEHMFQDRKSQRQGMPLRFKSFKNLRVVIDCTEIEIETPSNFQQQGNTWSSYKHRNTIKYLIGINTRGAIIYISEAFEGSMSDKEVFIRSSLYQMLQPGDIIMADRGFDIAHELDLVKAKLVIPSYLKGRDYLTAEEEIWTKKIARARIFVENAIGRLKMWRILGGRFTQSSLPLVSQMVYVCGCLTNFQPPLL